MVGGAGAYFYWNNLIYGEMAVYGTARQGVQQFLGAGTQTGTMIQDAAPYWRVFLNQQWGKHSVQVGHFGLVNRNISRSAKPATFDANGNPIPGNPNLLDTRGPIDRFTDLGFDAQYQFIGKKHLFTVQTSYIHEDQRLNNSDSQGGSFGNSAYLDKFKINANYYYRTDEWGSIGGTIAYVNLWGSKTSVPMIPPAPPLPSGSMAPGREAASGWANPTATGGFLNWIISRGGRSLSPRSRSSTPPTATSMGLAVCMMGMPGTLLMGYRLILFPFPGAMPLPTILFTSWSGRRSEA